MNTISGTGDWNPSLPLAYPKKQDREQIEATPVRGGASGQAINSTKKVEPNTRLVRESTPTEIVDRSLKIVKDPDTGSTVFKFKDVSGQDVQIPTEEALRSSKRIKDYLERITKDLEFGVVRPGKVDFTV
jgi:uncharacterized FlaG/YvyC family protein